MRTQLNEHEWSDGRRFVFIIGAPRSGTTWLSRMLGEHPGIAALPDELTLFSRYLAPAHESFQREKRHIDRGDWRQGLPLLYTEQEFDEGLKAIIRSVYQRVVSRKPEAALILDKHPAYTHHLPLMEHLIPGARYIHVLRDGRDTAISMLSARRRMGFGARTMEDAAKEWALSVQRARAHGRAVGADRYMELRYEQLLGDTSSGLATILRFCGLPEDPRWCESVAEQFRFDRRQVSGGDAALNALREQPGAIWRSRMSIRQRFVFDRVAGAWLVHAGYAAAGWWKGGISDRFLMSLYVLQRRIRIAAMAMRRAWSATPFKAIPIDPPDTSA